MSVVKPVEGKTDAFVSVVAVLENQSIDAVAFVAALHLAVSSNYTNYELVLVENGLAAERLPVLRDMLKELPCIRILRLSRKFAIDIAIFAGLESAIGDYVVYMTPGFDPVETVAKVILLAMSGNDVIQGISSVPLGGTWASRKGRTLFYGYNRRYLRIRIPERATYLTCLTRRAMNSLANASRTHRYLRHLIRHIGYRLTDFVYEPVVEAKNRLSLRSEIIKGAEMITSYSSHPLRFVTLIGVVAGVANLAYAFYVVILRLTRSDLAPGWTTTSLQLAATFFIFSAILAVQAEYIGRVLAETRREPLYFIMEEIDSDVLIADLDRRNLTN